MLLRNSRVLEPHPRFLISFKFARSETEAREGPLLAWVAVHRRRKDRKRERKGGDAMVAEGVVEKFGIPNQVMYSVQEPCGVASGTVGSHWAEIGGYDPRGAW